ncbi:hypothetical protein [Tenacibaculum xiamenense]|uniref:hypothetical protein n=1 Tax=Tenacibaculum xiamenense TaxID=1261553 RepID=UPI003894DDF6
MGKGTDAFKRELGKNTGKWVSNKIFGDGHSTPNRVSVKVQQQKLENDLRKAELKAEAKQRRAENRKELFSKGKELLSDIDDNKEEVIKTNNQLNEIIQTIIPEDKIEVLNFSNYLLLIIKTNGWKTGEKDKHINSLSDACLTKLEQCEMKLQSISASSDAMYLQAELKKLKKKKFIQKYLIFVGAGIFVLIMVILVKLGVLK